MVIGDVNNDGIPDLVVTNGCPTSGCDAPANPGVVSVLLGNGNGTFQPAISYAFGGSFAFRAAISDLNGDGNLDLVVSYYWSGLEVLLGNGDGTFQAPITYLVGADSIAIADLNGDGKLDLVLSDTSILSNGYTGGVGVMLGNGDGTFQAVVGYNPIDQNVYPTSVAVGDVNGDGKPDLVLAILCQSPNGEGCPSGSLAVLLGNGDGTFQTNPDTFKSGGIGARSVVIGDVNGDGKPDFLVVNSGSNGIGPNVRGADSVPTIFEPVGIAGVLLNKTAPVATTTAVVSSPNLSSSISP